MPRQVVVPGMHRSGTSMVAGVLQRLGVFMGEHLQAADSSNQRGHYEDLEFQRINKAILRDAGGSWRHPPSHEAIMGVTKYDRQMADLVARRDAEHEIWGWKDPRTCLTLAKWAPLLSDPIYLICQRRPHGVVFSLMARNHMGQMEAAQLSREYAKRLGDLDGRVIWYESALREPIKFVHWLADHVGASYSMKAVAFIDPSLDHSRIPTCA